MIKQLLPKAMKIPELSYYNLKGINYETAKSYLITLPTTNRTMGIEIVINNKGYKPLIFLEYHQIDLTLHTGVRDIIYPQYASTDCFTLYGARPSIFPFNINPTYFWRDLASYILNNEEMRIQLLFMKKTSDKLINQMWTQYEDYVNGVETPTDVRLFRSIQQGLLELSRKIEGAYRKNVRIPESERKLREDLFLFEARFYVISESDKRRIALTNHVASAFMQHNFANHWTHSKDTNKRKFLEHMQFRRFSLLGANTYLSSSELAAFFITEEFNEDLQTSVVTEVVEKPEPALNNDEFKNNPLTIFPKGKKKERTPDVHLATKLNKALRKLSLLSDDDVIIQKIQNGSTVQRITFTLPEGLKLSHLIKSSSDLQTELALNNISFEQGETAGTAALIIPQEEREAVFVGDLIDDESFKKYIKDAELPLLFGMGTLGDIVFTCLTAIKHLLICGTTGSGKSVFLNSLLTVLFALVDPKNLQVYMIDPKMVELSPYGIYPHVQKVYTNMDEVEPILAFLCETMDDRYKLFNDRGNYKTIQHYNRNEANKLPYIILVIEELADLMSTNKENEDYIVRLAQKARGAGIHLIIATQYPIKEVVTSLIKRNIISRACFALDSGTAYKVALDEAIPYDLLGKGDGVYKMEGKSGIHRFQSPLIGKDEEEQDRIIKKLSTYWTQTSKKVVIDTEAMKRKKIEKELNEFKQTVLESGETRLGELQKLLSIRNEKVKQFMDELVLEGWVVKHKSRAKGYELVLKDEEKKRFLEECVKK